MNKILKTFIFSAMLVSPALAKEMRAPSYPLISIDPYMSVWSSVDTLYSSNPVHWTNHDMPLTGILTVDGVPYRFMGIDNGSRVEIAPHSEIAEWSCEAGVAPFGTSKLLPDTWAPRPGTVMEGDICFSRQFTIPEHLRGNKIWLDITYEQEAELWLNGKKLEVPENGALHYQLPIPDSILNFGNDNTVEMKVTHPEGEYGIADIGVWAEIPAKNNTVVAKQIGLPDFQPTATRYEFECGSIKLNLEFLAPLLLDDLELLARPVNYINYTYESLDGKAHDVGISFEAGHQWAVNLPGQAVETGTVKDGKLIFGTIASVAQPILEKWGDDLRIDWGKLYIGGDGKNAKVELTDRTVTYSISYKKSNSGAGCVLVAYDDIYALEYMHERLRPYWNRKGNSTILTQLQQGWKERFDVAKRSTEFDNRLIADATKAGGDAYARLIAMTYRQGVHAHKLLEAPSGKLLYLSKENFSNGSVGTVDLTYPSSPLFLLYNPELLKGMMNGVFEYCASKDWGKPFAAHDIGRYPKANGQNYGGDMPVEESGNMLILAAAIAKAEGNAEYARENWDLLTTWANFLLENGLDPENQLCTDDFAGHLAHNANLSIKAILGIASYGQLSGMLGDKNTEQKWIGIAKKYAEEWNKLADDGDHYRLAFDKPGSWSMKYNLVWDNLLGLNIFPEEVTQKELPWYKRHGNMYGLPLDSRESYTKSDWLVWIASMAPTRGEFEAFISPLDNFYTETTDRIPMTDWYWTHRPEARHYREHATDKAFRARSVVGGHFMKLLKDKWNK